MNRKRELSCVVILVFLAFIYTTFHYGETVLNFSKAQLSPHRCTPVVAKFSAQELPLTALASFPGSGNTWLRHLVQQATGLATGSVYCEKYLKADFPGECVKNRSLPLIKTHLRSFNINGKIDRLVLLVRNPFDAIKAEFKRLSTHRNQTGTPKHFSESKWRTHVEKCASDWSMAMQFWLSFDGPIHVVRYENLLSDPFNEVTDLVKFLNVPMTLKDAKCFLETSEGNYHRPKENIKLIYDENLKQTVQNQIDKISLLYPQFNFLETQQ